MHAAEEERRQIAMSKLPEEPRQEDIHLTLVVRLPSEDRAQRGFSRDQTFCDVMTFIVSLPHGLHNPQAFVHGHGLLNFHPRMLLGGCAQLVGRVLATVTESIVATEPEAPVPTAPVPASTPAHASWSALAANADQIVIFVSDSEVEEQPRVTA